MTYTMIWYNTPQMLAATRDVGQAATDKLFVWAARGTSYIICGSTNCLDNMRKNPPHQLYGENQVGVVLESLSNLKIGYARKY